MTDEVTVFNNLQEAARYMRITKQGVLMAIKKKLLRATRNGRKWQLSSVDIQEYLESKFDRSKRKDESGNLYFDIEEGYFSAPQVQVLLSKELGHISMARVYYLLKTGRIKGLKKGVSWIVTRKELENFIAFHKNHQMFERKHVS